MEENLIHHLFLPKKLPGTDKGIEDMEAALLSRMRSFLAEFHLPLSYGFDFGWLVSLFDTWNQVQGEPSRNSESDEASSVAETISKMPLGASFVFYVREQNSTILIKRKSPSNCEVEEERLTFSAFIVSQPNKCIFEGDGDLVGEFPAICIDIPYSSLVRSEDFIEVLKFLANNEQLSPRREVRKAGNAFSEPRDVAHPMYVTQYLTALLTDEKSGAVEDVARIRKKIRDQVNYKSSYRPFRRSGMWMSIKVILQLELVDRFGENEGYVLYKLIMISFLDECCNEWCLKGNISADITSQMIAKISIRLAKLYEQEHLKNIQPRDECRIPDWYDETKKQVELTVRVITGDLQAKWDSVIAKNSKIFSLDKVSLGEDLTTHELEGLFSHLGKLTSSNQQQMSKDFSPPIEIRFKTNEFETMFPKSKLETAKGEEAVGQILYDFERWIYHLSETRFSASNVKEFFTLFENYISCAKTFYTNERSVGSKDPVGASRMVLTCLKMLQMFDVLAVQKFILLRDHGPGVNLDIIQDLLLPQKADLLLAQKVEKYFKIRSEMATYPSLINQNQNEFTKESFASRYASCCSHMVSVKNQILREIEEKSALKRQEALRLKEEYLRIKPFLELEHERETRLNQYGIPVTKCLTRGRCRKCRYTRESKKLKLCIYEKSLPEEDYEQDAIVFELRIPLEIATLRDALYIFSKQICSNVFNTCEIEGYWTKYDALKKYKTETHQKYVHLVSSSKLTATSHYGSGPLHVSLRNDFVCNNGYNCKLGNDEKRAIILDDMSRKHVKAFCTFSVEACSRYAGMQWTLSSTTHTQNQVLAKQSDCPKQLPLSEYTEFGTLRAGHRLQIRNIYRALAHSSLSFKESSVLSLLCQSLWEAGVSSDKFCRESHEDFGSDEIFTSEFLDMMNTLIETSVKNWNDQYLLLIIILLCNRILALSTGNRRITDKAVKLVQKCRSVSLNWANSIEKLLGKLQACEVEQQAELRIKLIHILAFGALTFVGDGTAEVYEKITSDLGHLVVWLQCITRIRDNLVLTTLTLENLPRPTKNLLRWVRCAAIDFEDYFHSHRNCKAGLRKFVKEYWSDASDKLVEMLDGFKQWYCFGLASDASLKPVVHIDIVLGKFLVHGRPIGGLTSQITQHKYFTRLFGGYVFIVQLATLRETSNAEYITKERFHDCFYKFGLAGGELIVIEVDGKGNECQLIPHNIFDRELPFSFIENYSHWWNRSERCIEFRSKHFFGTNFRKTIKYRLHLETKSVEENSSSRLLVSIGSLAYKEITRIMSLLEHPRYIHMFVHKGKTEYDPSIIIELPRMALHFYTVSGSIWSKEYRGYKIAAQKLGTLIGIQNGILLTTDYGNPILLLPHGTPKTILGSDHQQVSIDYETLRKPEFFVIEVDSRLRRLIQQPYQSAWLYLAHLHALTSGTLPDPLTGMTGTETAIQLLQSPVCWSCEPLDPESSKTLACIADLSPRREFYPAHLKQMETVSFPFGMPSLAAHDGFRFLAWKLKTDSVRGKFMYATDVLKDSEPLKQEDLSKRAYWRNSTSCSPQAQISPEFDSNFRTEPLCNNVSTLDLPSTFPRIVTSYNDKIMKSVRLLAHYGKLTEHSDLRNGLQPELLNVLCQQESLSGQDSSSYHRENLNNWNEIDIKQSWLKLYNHAVQIKENGWEASWTMMLCAFAYSKKDQFGNQDVLTEHLMLLHTVAKFPEQFEGLKPPNYPNFSNTNENFFNSDIISSTLDQHAKEFIFSSHRDEEETFAELTIRAALERDAHEKEVKRQHATILAYLQENGLVPNCDIYSKYSHFEYINVQSASYDIDVLLKKWYRNKQLEIFVNTVISKFKSLQLRSEQDSITYKQLNLTVDQSLLTKFAHRRRFNAADVWYDKANSLQESEIISLDRLQKSDDKNVRQFGRRFQKSNDFPLTQHLDFLREKNDSGISQILKEYRNELEMSWQRSCDTYPVTSSVPSKAKLVELQGNIKTQLLVQLTALEDHIKLEKKNPVLNALVDSGVFHRTTPCFLLKQLLNVGLNKALRKLIEQLGVLFCEDQKVTRCLRLLAAGSSAEILLKRELETQGFDNWTPRERPEWLLLQLELDLMIRPVQVGVAKKMGIEFGKHSLMQLNMGEGKTSVIIPMLLATLANGKQLARVTVLKSLYNTNRKLLTFTLGNMLNQRIYTFPCRRDMEFTGEHVKIIQDLYEECRQKKGVVITAPEYRLSFQLKGYDESLRLNRSLGRALVNTNLWLRSNVRDILDECDEILNVKYQLIYTIGGHEVVSGGYLRWIICQKLLKLLPNHLSAFLNENEVEPIVQMKHLEGGNGSFPLCRILNQNCYQELCKRLAGDILHPSAEDRFGLRDLNISEIEKVMTFITMPSLTQTQHEAAITVFRGTDTDSTLVTQLDTILVLRGLLASGVLLLGLTKRWRVNYGVNPAGPKKMAVPFRAKDVASERTEFGHADVAILLTQLSYYYSGLTEEQVRECFTLLLRLEGKEQIYSDWINDLHSQVDPGISKLSGINLDDYIQMMEVTIPTFRKNMKAIDFWLSKVVYPKEAKQSPQKMMCSPWDLCSDDTQHPATGFSGTNDTKLLLPLTVGQNDLPELMGTNGQVLRNILLEVNNQYSVVETGVSGKEVLEQLVQKKIPLLLDVGALIIDLTNEKLAEIWLATLRKHHLESEYDAAVYFNESDELVVKDHEGRVTSLQLSPFRTHMERCVVYLDDIHTRGTDLKIPRGTVGCVTLGKGVTKDKLVQGCMRMRMLGNGHSVAFFASREVDNEIQAITHAKKIGVKEVITWALHNSCVVTRDGFQQWISSAANFYTKKLAQKLFDESHEDEIKLAEHCCEDETLGLEDVYGKFQTEQEFSKIAENRMLQTQLRLDKSSEGAEKLKINELFKMATTKIVERCDKSVKNVKRLAHLFDEEQEREVQEEKEQEKEIQRPGRATPHDHNLFQEFLQYVKTDRTCLDEFESINSSMCWYQTLPAALKETKMWNIVQEECWGQNIFATVDFCKTVENRNCESSFYSFTQRRNYVRPSRRDEDEFIRPVTWILSKSVSQKKIELLLLSPFEANAIIPLIRGLDGCSGVKLHMFSPRLHPKHSTFWTSTELTLPTGLGLLSIPNYSSLNANLLLFSGSQYFSNSKEQDAYCDLLGLVPHPRSKQETEAFEKGWIKHGFLLPNFRFRRLGKRYGISRFERSPESLAKAIINCRHESHPSTSHVARILTESTKTNFGTEENLTEEHVFAGNINANAEE